MRILILGAAGMLGRKLVERLVRDGVLGPNRSGSVTLVDLVEPDAPTSPGFDVETVVADIADPGGRRLLSSRPDVVFHLAAVVSGEAEADFELGYRVNLDGTRHAARGGARERRGLPSRASSSRRRSPCSARRCPR